MNFKIAFVGAALMAFAGIVTVGCGGNDCETAADASLAKYESCPDYKAPATTSGTSTSTECTDAAGKLLTCQSACITAASCECIGFDKSKTCATDDITKYAKCQTDCLAAK